MLEQLGELDEIARLESVDHRIRDIQKEIHEELEMYNKMYHDDIERLIPYFTQWYIVLKSKYSELIN